MQEKVMNQLKDATKDMKHSVKDAEQEIRGTLNQELGGVKSAATRTEDKVEKVKTKVEDVKEQLEKEMKQIKTDFGSQFAEMKDLILACTTNSVEAREFAKLKAEKKKIEREGDDCAKMLHTSEAMLRDCQERAKKHEDWTPDDAIKSFADYVSEVYHEYFTWTGIWRKLRTYSRVWVITKFLAQTMIWISSLSWWAFLFYIFVAGNVVVVILSILLSFFKLADDAMSVSERIWRLLTAIVSGVFCVLYYLFYWGWLTLERLLMLVVILIHPTVIAQEEPPPRRRTPPPRRPRPQRQDTEDQSAEIAAVEVVEQPQVPVLQRMLMAYQRTNPVRPVGEGSSGQNTPEQASQAAEAGPQPQGQIAQIDAVVEPVVAPVEQVRAPMPAPAAVAPKEPYVVVAARNPISNSPSPQRRPVPRTRTPERRPQESSSGRRDGRHESGQTP